MTHRRTAPARPRLTSPATSERGRGLTAGRLVAGALTVAAVAVLTSCPTSVDFDDYESVNLISSRGFDSGMWYFADGLDQETDPSAPFDYVEFETVPSSDYGSLPTGVSGPVYRLEVVNLFTDGTFEQDLALDDTAPLDTAGAGWVEDDSETDGDATDLANPTITSTANGIDGRSLELNFSDPTPYYAVDLSSALRDGTFSNNETYAYHLDFRMGIQTIGLELHNNTPATPSYSVISDRRVSRGQPISETNVYAFPGSLGEDTLRFDANATGNNLIQPESGLLFFSFGGFDTTTQVGTISAVIDNIRFVRADQYHYLRLPVPYADAGRPEITSGGTYTITVWVRNDTTAGDTGSAVTANRVPARFFGAGLDPRYNRTVPVTKTSGVPGTARSFVGDLTGWEQLSFTIPGSSISLPSGVSSGTIVFDLVVEVGHNIAGSAFKDSGSVFMADIELLWNPN